MRDVTKWVLTEGEFVPESGHSVTRVEAPSGPSSVRIVRTHEHVLSDSEHKKLCALVSDLAGLPSRLDRALKLARGGPVKPSDALETFLTAIEKTLQDRFVRNSVRDRKVLRTIALDLEKSGNVTERVLGQMFMRYLGTP